MKRVVGFIIAVTACVLAFCGFVSYAKEKQETEEELYKYFTSVEIQPGDSLWSIAESQLSQMDVECGCSVEEYIEELRQMNGLTGDTIYAGRYLTVFYYRDTPVEMMVQDDGESVR